MADLSCATFGVWLDCRSGFQGSPLAAEPILDHGQPDPRALVTLRNVSMCCWGWGRGGSHAVGFWCPERINPPHVHSTFLC